MPRNLIHSLLVVLMLWLPLGQAMASCCPMNTGDVAMAMPQDCPEHADAAITLLQHDAGDCQGECLQLGQAAVVSLPDLPGREQPARDPGAALLTRLLPAHQDPLLRPPRRRP